jgi:hypothetical protein
MVPGFAQPALASKPPGGNLYFAQDAAVTSKSPGEIFIDNIQAGQNAEGPRPDLAPTLVFGGSAATTPSGEAIVNAANSSKGHFTELLNFHGSPAPWILIGILLAAGLLHLEAAGKIGVKGKL